MPTYFEGQDLTDDALLTPDTLKICTIGTTNPRDIPKTLNLKDSDHFDYYTKNLRVTYPGCSPSTTMAIPNVVIHYDTFDQFGKTGVYVGVPQTFVDALRTKLNSAGNKPVFEDVALASDEKYWWTRCGFLPAEAGKEYIYIIDEEDGEIVEDPYPGFPELFAQIKSSVVCNITCAVKMTAKIHVDKKEESSDDEPPGLEEAPAAAGGDQSAQDKATKQSRSEKKSRKAIQKLGMKPVSGIIRVTVKKAKGMLFVITKPDVFKSPNSDTYIIFGEAKIEDGSQRGYDDELKKWNPEAAAAGAAGAAAPASDAAATAGSAAKSAESDEPVDETGVSTTDIDLVMSQTKASRGAAVRALKNHNGDIVNAIMELTM